MEEPPVLFPSVRHVSAAAGRNPDEMNPEMDVMDEPLELPVQIPDDLPDPPQQARRQVCQPVPQEILDCWEWNIHTGDPILPDPAHR